MKTVIEKAEVDDQTYYDLACECGFLSEGWPTKKLATARRDQHVAEHETGDPAPPKAELLSVPAEDRAAQNISDALARRRRS